MTASTLLEGGVEARAERTFPCLDGLRLIAATAVVLTHVGFWTGSYTETPLGRALARMDVGVPIFFVLSGFLLSRPYLLAAAERRRPPRPAAYLWRRALRILPAYWLTVVAALLLLPGNAGAGAGEWLRHLTLTQLYVGGPAAEGLTHAWSLCTEVAFYLVLPPAGAALARSMRRRPDRPTRALAGLVAAAAAAQLWVVLVWAAGPAHHQLDLWLPGFLGWFAGGIGLALVTAASPAWGPAAVARQLGHSLPLCWTGAAVLFLVAMSPLAGPLGLVGPSPLQALAKNLLYLAIAVLVVLPLVVGDHRRGLAHRLLASPPVVFLGEISYGIFLVHLVLLTGGYAAFGWAPFSGNLVAVLMATWTSAVVVAAIVYAVVERPLRRCRRLVPDRPAEPVPPRTEALTAATATSASV